VFAEEGEKKKDDDDDDATVQEKERDNQVQDTHRHTFRRERERPYHPLLLFQE